MNELNVSRISISEPLRLVLLGGWIVVVVASMAKIVASVPLG